MKMVGFWGKFNLLELFSYKKSLYGIRSFEVFREILKRERARCDRNGYKFSLIVIDPVKIKENNGAIIDLLIALRRRLRLADEIGWFDQNKIGVMLPDTPAKGAWNIAKEISEKFGSGLSTISFMVYTYPPDWAAGNEQTSLRISFSNEESKIDAWHKNIEPHLPGRHPIRGRSQSLKSFRSALGGNVR